MQPPPPHLSSPSWRFVNALRACSVIFTSVLKCIKVKSSHLLLFGVVFAVFVLPRSPALLSVVEGLVTGTVATKI